MSILLRLLFVFSLFTIVSCQSQHKKKDCCQKKAKAECCMKKDKKCDGKECKLDGKKAKAECCKKDKKCDGKECKLDSKVCQCEGCPNKGKECDSKTCKCAAGQCDGKSCKHGAHHGDHKHPAGMAMQHDFSDAEKWSKRFDNETRDSWQKPSEIIRIMGIQSGENVADIGAGTGYLVPHLSKAVGTKGKVFALDVEKNLITFMKKRFKTENLRNAIAELIPFTEPGERVKEVNKVVILNTWHHIAERKSYAQKLYGSLAKNGEVFIIEPLKGTGGPGPKDSHRSTPSMTSPELEAVGFKCEEAKESLQYQFILVCRK